jgi:hypothetical protein
MLDAVVNKVYALKLYAYKGISLLFHLTFKL